MGQTHETTHEIVVAADAEAIYDLLADVTRWPVLFTPTVHAEQLETDGASERIQLWATANDEAKSWCSRRELDRGALHITFRQEVSQHPVAAMTGTWDIRRNDDGTATVVLGHTFEAVGDLPENVEWISAAVERNSTTELANLKRIAENAADAVELTSTFADSVDIAGDVSDVYSFLYRSDLWPQRLPHVDRLELTEDTPNLQVMAMDTRTANGAVHTTRSVRVCFGEHRIVYKQQVLPPLLSVHNGVWTLQETGDGVRATSEHTVVIKRERVEELLGEGTTVTDAIAYVRNALGTNSTATLKHAKAFAEERRRG